MTTTARITTLPSGLRVITDAVPSVESVAIGIWADVGTRHENLSHNGVAHMVEHMMFNGTPTRNSLEIAETIENVGGQINAYTSRENTAYYIHLLKQDTPLALDILSDMIQRPSFPEKEIEKERGVILQEIGMSNDTPDDIVFDHYQETAYPGQSLGAPILGRAEIVQSMTREVMYDYVQRFYTPDKLVISASGNLDHDDIVRQVNDLFGELPKVSNQTFEPASYVGGENRQEKNLEQSHIVLGFQGITRHNEDYYAAVLLATVLGGGMSSRLFQEVREKRGLVYSIYSSHSAYHDDGQFEIYAGTGPEKLPELMPVLADEIKKVQQELISADEINRAKAQLRASLLMSRESMMSRANRQGKYLIHFGEAPDILHMVDRINDMDAQTIQTMAQKIFASRPTLAALGPLAALEDYDGLEKKLAA